MRIGVGRVGEKKEKGTVSFSSLSPRGKKRGKENLVLADPEEGEEKKGEGGREGFSRSPFKSTSLVWGWEEKRKRKDRGVDTNGGGKEKEEALPLAFISSIISPTWGGKGICVIPHVLVPEGKRKGRRWVAAVSGGYSLAFPSQPERTKARKEPVHNSSVR